jgi:hypothetical protein
MADLSLYMEGVDDAAIEASTGVPEPLAPGNYTLQAEKFELNQTKDRTGMLLKATLSVVGGPFEGRKIFPQFNIRNKSAQAQTIGIAEFKALCKAAGVDYDTAKLDTDNLLYHPFNATVGMEKEQTNPTTGQPYPPKNRVTKYIPFGGDAAASAPPATVAPAVAAAAVAAAKPAAAGGMPWSKK